MCRINPRVDFAFKKLFGSEENKDLLLALINAILAERVRIEEIELKNPYNLADYQAGKISILDIKARDDRGRWLNIEMQIGQDLNFDKRAIYYWSKLVTEQLSEGMRRPELAEGRRPELVEGMFRELKKTISINILDFNFIPDQTAFHNIYKIINTRTGKDDNLHDLFELHYIELRKFRKGYEEIASALDRWITFLTRAHELNRKTIPAQLASDSAIVKAIEAVDRMFNEEERDIYEVRMEAIADVDSKIASALAEGEEKGEENKERMMILQASRSGMDADAIAEMFGLELERVKRILESKEGMDDGATN
jgi:predicted transposase/invertase (TIGR01784 family)